MIKNIHFISCYFMNDIHFKPLYPIIRIGKNAYNQLLLIFGFWKWEFCLKLGKPKKL